MLAFLLNKVSFQSKQHGAKAPLLRMNKMSFDDFWSKYPRKVAKKAAMQAFAKELLF